MIREKRYVDVSDLPEDVQEAYHDFVYECGVSNGQHWPWEVGSTGDNCVPESWIGREKCDIIDTALRNLGLKDGQEIDLVLEW